MKINLTESEKITLKCALSARYNHAEENITRLKKTISANVFSLGYVLGLQFYSNMKSDSESIYKKIFNEDIKKEIKE